MNSNDKINSEAAQMVGRFPFAVFILTAMVVMNEKTRSLRPEVCIEKAESHFLPTAHLNQHPVNTPLGGFFWALL